MFKLSALLAMVACGLLTSSFASESRLREIRSEKAKLKSYIDKGFGGPEIQSEIKKLEDEERRLTKSHKKKVVQPSREISGKKVPSYVELTKPKEDKTAPKINLSAILDLYYLYSPARGQEGTVLDNRVYDQNTNDFTMNLFELNLSGKVGKVSFSADLDFGEFAEQNSAHNGDPENHNIGEAYLSYDITDATSLSFGKMYTHVGYEVAKAIDNWNYSRSWAFTLAGPFWHEGVSVSHSFENGLSLGGYVYDSWDATTENNANKTLGAQLGYSDDKLSFYLNYIGGNENDTGSGAGIKSVVEFNTQYQVYDSLAIAFNALTGTNEEASAPESGSENVDTKWSAYVLYAHYKVSDSWAITPRLEIFNDDTTDAATSGYIFSGMGATKENTINSSTLTFTNYLDENSEIRLEYRQDKADEKLWTDEDAEKADSLTTIGVAWLAKF